MITIVNLIDQVAIALYIFLAVGALLNLRGLLRARGAWRATQYELERELARYQQVSAFTMLIIFAQAALIVLGVQRVAAPYLNGIALAESGAQVIQLEDGTLVTSTAPPPGDPFRPDTSGVVIGDLGLGEAPLATPVPTATLVGTLQPNPPAAVGCDQPSNAVLQIPANGMVVFDPITIRGVANVENFAYYRLELGGGQLGNFAVLQTVTVPVPELGDLGQFTPAVFPSDEYRFRLTVFDISNTLRASCELTIFITDPPPTATPFATAQPAAAATAGN
ncbi:MAG: hypothetical protein SF123_25255 [Chloroflexota bacterium]|nr:hypothetical protein [Chloroflexota bacterium]